MIKSPEQQPPAEPTPESRRDQEPIVKGFAVFADTMAGDAFVGEVTDTTREELKSNPRGAHDFDSVFSTQEEAQKRVEEINNS